MCKTSSKIQLLMAMVFTFFMASNAMAQQVIKMEGTDQMKFTVEEIVASPGEEITVILVNNSKLPAVAMSHNFVLIKKSADAKAFSMAGAKFRDDGYIDPSKKDQIIAMTEMAGGGETVKVTFKAPKEAGSYPYVCTFPGHYIAGMKGMLIVK